MTNEKLIKLAASVIKPRKLGSYTAGDVGCAVLSKKGKVYLGVCVDTGVGSFDAEQNALLSMITDGEYRIKKIVAIWKDKKGSLYVLHPCGVCREFMRQIDKRNMEAEIILGKSRIVKLKNLLPYYEDFSRV